MRVDRESYQTLNIVMCPLPRCNYRWCKFCRKEVRSCDAPHRCRNWKLDGIAWTKGWKSCPGIQIYIDNLEPNLKKMTGCGVVVERISGCNHMTVSGFSFARSKTRLIVISVCRPRMFCVRGHCARSAILLTSNLVAISAIGVASS